LALLNAPYTRSKKEGKTHAPGFSREESIGQVPLPEGGEEGVQRHSLVRRRLHRKKRRARPFKWCVLRAARAGTEYRRRGRREEKEEPKTGIELVYAALQVMGEEGKGGQFTIRISRSTEKKRKTSLLFGVGYREKKKKENGEVDQRQDLLPRPKAFRGGKEGKGAVKTMNEILRFLKGTEEKKRRQPPSFRRFSNLSTEKRKNKKSLFAR